ncbi:MAG TPA: alpha/beta hydrolase [Ilumatobacteraceae bacterium]|nr:alpha/beta hydrolase [Ilumatobacteraceae bacterium]
MTESIVDVGGTPITVLRGGAGRPLLMLHDELGFPGWMRWNEQLAEQCEFVIPLQPGFGHTPRIPWLQDFRDLATFYGRLLRQLELGPTDVIGFSAGGFIAAEMAVMAPDLFERMVLVAPLGVRPQSGEIFDFLASTMMTHVAATVSHHEVEEFGQIYGGDMTAEQFELFEAARGETSRLGWEPFMFNPSLPHHLQGLCDLPTLVVWGEDDLIVPRGAIDAYEEALPNVEVHILPAVGHRPEIEDVDGFVGCVSKFLLPRDH